MAEPVTIEVSLSAEPLDLATLTDRSADPRDGATALFVGTVRRSASEMQGQDVDALEYDAHPDIAEQEMQRVAKEAAERWSLSRVTLIHRTGRCELAEPTVFVACSAPHRAAAFEACRWAIDTLKATVPIWKKEIYSDGSAWVGAEGT